MSAGTPAKLLTQINLTNWLHRNVKYMAIALRNTGNQTTGITRGVSGGMDGYGVLLYSSIKWH